MEEKGDNYRRRSEEEKTLARICEKVLMNYANMYSPKTLIIQISI